MISKIEELKKISDKACFFNFSFFHRNLDCDWLKIFVLFYDYFIFENRHTINTPNGLRHNFPEVWSLIESNAIFLDDFDGLLNRRNLNESLMEMIKPILLTKNMKLNKQFVNSFYNKMKCRDGGFSDFSRHIRMHNELAVSSELEIELGIEHIIIDELVDSYISCYIKSTIDVPFIVDDVGDFVFKKVIGQQIQSDSSFNTFQFLLIKEIPDFIKLSWDAILFLRNNKNRNYCIDYMKQVPLNQSIIEHLKESLWRLVTEAEDESSIVKSVLKGLVGNLPLLNPISAFLSSKDTYKLYKKNNNFGWIYFLNAIRKKIKEKEEPFTLIPKSVRLNND